MVMEGGEGEASQPTCTSTSGEVHHVYFYLTYPDAGTLLSPLNIAMICVRLCICVCCVCVCGCVCVCLCVCVLVEFVQMCIRHFVF